MKKIFVITLSILMLSISSFASSSIEKIERNEIKNMTQEQRTFRVEQLETRVNELREKNLKELEGSEKRAVKSELKYIQKELKTHERSGGGIYLSLTAILVIILLIIIL